MNYCVIYNGHIWQPLSHRQANEIATNVNKNITMIHNYIIYKEVYFLHNLFVFNLFPDAVTLLVSIYSHWQCSKMLEWKMPISLASDSECHYIYWEVL